MSLKITLVPPQSTFYTGNRALDCFYPEDETTCFVLDMPWAAAFAASFSRKIQLYLRKKTPTIYLTKASNSHASQNK